MLCKHCIPEPQVYDRKYLTVHAHASVWVLMFVCFLLKEIARPTLSSESISSQAKNNREESIFSEKPLYFHWLALELANAFLSASNQLEEKNDIQVKIGTSCYTIKRCTLDSSIKAIKIAESLQTITKPQSNFGILSSPELCQQELTFSALLARAMGHVCTKDQYAKNIAIVGDQKPVICMLCNLTTFQPSSTGLP